MVDIRIVRKKKIVIHGNTNADIPTCVSISFQDFDALYTEISQNHPAEEQLIASGFFKKVVF